MDIEETPGENQNELWKSSIDDDEIGVKENSSSTVPTFSSSSPSRSPSPNLKNSNVPKRTKLSPAVNEGASTSKQGLQQDNSPNSSPIDCISACGRYSNISWISDGSDCKNGSPSGTNQSRSPSNSVQRKRESPVTKWCDATKFGLNMKTKILNQIAWPNASLNLWFVKARVLNFESTERNFIRFLSNISLSRPYCIFLLNQPFRYKSNVNYLINLTPSDPKSGKGQALNSLCDTGDLFFVSMIQHMSPLRNLVKTGPWSVFLLNHRWPYRDLKQFKS